MTLENKSFLLNLIASFVTKMRERKGRGRSTLGNGIYYLQFLDFKYCDKDEDEGVLCA